MELLQIPGFFVQRTVSDPRRHVGDMGQDARIEPIRLCQLADALGKVTHLSRIDTRHRQAGRMQYIQRPLRRTSGRLKNDLTQIEALQPRDQLHKARRIVSEPCTARWPCTATSRNALLTSTPAPMLLIAISDNLGMSRVLLASPALFPSANSGNRTGVARRYRRGDLATKRSS